MFKILPVLILTTIGFASAGLSTSDLTFNANGVSIHYILKGKGEPVVLIHGLHSSARMNWQMPGIIDDLSRNYQVIALDLPGHGESDRPSREEAYGLEMVEVVVRLLDHLKIKKAHIIGYSLGGMIALKLAARHPQRVRTVVVGGMGWMREGSFLQKVWERTPEREGSRTPAECVRSIGRLALTREELSGIRIPLIVLVGDRDPVKRLYVASLQEARRDWTVIEIKDAGHLNCIVRAQFKEEIRRWLASHPHV